MFIGEPPFTGPTPTMVLLKRLAEPPPPLEKRRPDAPELLRNVIEGMLATDPALRFQSAGDVVRTLGGATAAIAGGPYTVGSDDGPALSRPAHTVTVAPFGVGAREVTVGEYAAFVVTGQVSAPWSAQPDSLLPVTGVTFGEAMNFCGWKHPPDGRLLTEAEWEAVARGTPGRRYPWGTEGDPAAANTESARRAGPAPVGSYPRGRTPEGVHDLIGNVWEWTMTPVAPYPGGPPIPNLAANAGSYVIRGGAFNTPDATASTITRGYLHPSTARSGLDKTGFRCAMPLRSAAP